MSFLNKKIIFITLFLATLSIFKVFANEEFNTFAYNAKLKLGNINILETSKLNQNTTTNTLGVSLDRNKINILICDSEYYYEDEYICDELELSSSINIDYIVDESFNPTQNYILQKKIEDVTVLVIPQNYIENKDIATKTAQHLNSYIKHTKFKENSEVESLPSRISSSLVANSNYSMMNFFVLIVLSIIFTSIISNKKEQKKSNYFKTASAVIIILAIAVLLNASKTDIGKIDFIFIREYVLYTFTLKNWWSIVAAFSKTRILLLALAGSWLGLLLFKFKRSLIDVAKKIPRIYAEDKTYHLVLVVIVLSILITITIGVNPLRKNIAFIHSVFITLLYLIFIGNKSIEKIKTNIRYLIFIILATTSLITIKSVDKKSYYENKILIGSSDNVVYLPYRKEHTQDALFEDQYFKDTVSFTIDDYLVYYPGYDMIINTNKDMPQYDLLNKQNIGVITRSKDGTKNVDNGKILVNIVEGKEYVSELKNSNGVINLSTVVNDMQTRGLLGKQFIISSYSGDDIIIRYDL